jgi:hypothetical protein
MTFRSMNFRANPIHRLISQVRSRFARLAQATTSSATQRPGKSALSLLGLGAVLGATLAAGASYAEMAHLRQLQSSEQARLDATRDQAQREVNALAARLGELQAQANRLNALGERWAGTLPNQTDWRTQAGALGALTAAAG